MSETLHLCSPLTGQAARFWSVANRRVLWGWKRDEGPHSRVVYYSARLCRGRSGIVAEDHVFFYKHRSDAAAIDRLAEELDAAAAGGLLAPARLERRSGPNGLAMVVFRAGEPSAPDADRIWRLQLRRPRKSLGPRPAVKPSRGKGLDALFPTDLYAGSGVSYEAGLPTLCDMHDAFGVDDHARGAFTVGAADRLPDRLASDTAATLRSFCRCHLAALHARPTAAQRTIAELYRRGFVRSILTDNVDNLFAKVGVPFERTRGSGVFNERFPATFHSRNLLVVGVAADRRQIIRQARGKGLRVTVVDPCQKVSPRVQHLNYLRPRDRFVKETAEIFFGRVRAALDVDLAEREEEAPGKVGSAPALA